MLSIALTLALLMSIGFICQWIGWRFRLPAILFLLISGLLLGPVTGWIQPDQLLGDLLFPMVSLGVAVILFEGSLSLRFAEIRGVTKIIRNLSTIGVVVTMMGLTLAAHYLAGLSWSISAVFGAIATVTGPTVIVPMLRSMHTTSRVANILRWEGIIIDPVAALLAVIVYEAVVSGQQTQPIWSFFSLVAAGSVLGGLGALVMTQVLKRHWVPEYLANFFVLSLVLLVFASANQVVHESGLLAVTLMGIIVANTKDIAVSDILDFKEHLTVLLISFLFIILAARMDLSLVRQLGWSAAAVLCAAQLVVRPFSVLASKIGTSINWREYLLLSWVAPRGIVAAAISALFALQLTEHGFDDAELLLPLMFTLIVGTVVLQSATARPLAKWLGLSQAGAQGVFIFGANKVSIEIAKALEKQGVDVLIADDSWAGIQEARMQGLRIYYGNILSEHADLYLDLTGMTRMFLMGRRPELNTLIYTRYRPEFGSRHIYALNLSISGDNMVESKRLVADLQVQTLFGPDMSWQKIASLLGQGAEIKWTRLTEEFTIEDYRRQWGKNAYLLFAFTPEGRLRVYRGPDSLPLGPGWTVGALVLGAREQNSTGKESNHDKVKNDAEQSKG
ncbi:MAG: sodium:proton antiporter [Gammaproteobacteria bacterium]|nr:MAG: sodium:proton antiporter [Gammaproteobacteria bacterium]